jgi:hypothetical protein
MGRALRRDVAECVSVEYKTRNTFSRHHPRRRMIQHSEASAMESKSHGILDRRFRGWRENTDLILRSLHRVREAARSKRLEGWRQLHGLAAILRDAAKRPLLRMRCEIISQLFRGDDGSLWSGAVRPVRYATCRRLKKSSASTILVSACAHPVRLPPGESFMGDHE